MVEQQKFICDELSAFVTFENKDGIGMSLGENEENNNIVTL